MSFNIALSGIAASQKDLDSTANNIANVNTYGFKGSRAEFTDVYASSVFTNSKTNVGGGVSTSQVAQQFHQGSLLRTNNALDMAINGNGYFVMSGGNTNGNSMDFSYTRSGAFKLNSDNYIVDSQDNFLQAFPVDADGNSTSVSLSTTQPIRIPDTAGNPKFTENVTLSMNLNAGELDMDPALFDPTDATTFNNSTSVTIYDSVGNPHILTTYFVKIAGGSSTTENNWASFYAVDGQQVNVWDTATDTALAGTYDQDIDADGTPDVFGVPVQTAGGWTGSVMKFDSAGNFLTSVPATIETQTLGLTGTGAGVLSAGTDGTQNLTINMGNPTQFASVFEVTELRQDGQTVGRLTNVEVGADGLVSASYSNGTQKPLGRVALARFNNDQGLTQIGNTSWKQSLASGEALAGEANFGTFGSVNSASLEQSNVDLTTELTDLITAQRNFQANSRTLEVNSTLQQTILQIR
ncbi:flagellar hook protein FlgE [Paraferrimonas sp. SM1919]|uniref:flagellar hook protein FlgE n=1 Tax=Paraferrimonas sp. SM1919 TaxID=2662263 RepID=UPI0013D3F7C0|nr:flagellar hook protein FlgE [Paraferrimonas sp. SM1919]